VTCAGRRPVRKYPPIWPATSVARVAFVAVPERVIWVALAGLCNARHADAAAVAATSGCAGVRAAAGRAAQPHADGFRIGTVPLRSAADYAVVGGYR